MTLGIKSDGEKFGVPLELFYGERVIGQRKQ